MSFLQCIFIEDGIRCDTDARLYDGQLRYCPKHNQLADDPVYHRLRKVWRDSSPEVWTAMSERHDAEDAAKVAEQEYSLLWAEYRNGILTATLERVEIAKEQHLLAETRRAAAYQKEAQVIWDARERQHPGINASEAAERRERWAAKLTANYNLKT